jgi:hypothetical protein
MNKTGIIQIRFERTSALFREANKRKRVKKTNTPIEMIETFTSTFPIFIGKIIGG